MGDLSDLDGLPASNGGDAKSALDALFPELFADLHRIAQACLAHERPHHTLQLTALVNEAYLRLLEQHHLDLSCRPRVLGLAARMMRRILVNYGEARRARKRGFGCRITLDDRLDLADSRQVDVQSLDRALTKLEQIDERQVRIVELRFFSGLNVEQTAEVLDVSPATVKREWKIARLWLMREIERL
jgi:RNA polymerase sigma factor (TIGR02999 family)